jgi:hypothetical protein
MFKLEFNPLNGYIVGEQATGESQYGFEYSVVKSSFSYGGERGLYEFAGYDEAAQREGRRTSSTNAVAAPKFSTFFENNLTE